MHEVLDTDVDVAGAAKKSGLKMQLDGAAPFQKR